MAWDFALPGSTESPREREEREQRDFQRAQRQRVQGEQQKLRQAVTERYIAPVQRVQTEQAKFRQLAGNLIRQQREEQRVNVQAEQAKFRQLATNLIRQRQEEAPQDAAIQRQQEGLAQWRAMNERLLGSERATTPRVPSADEQMQAATLLERSGIQMTPEERARTASYGMDVTQRLLARGNVGPAADIGAPHTGPEGARLPVVGDIPGLRTLPEAAATIGTAGLGSGGLLMKTGMLGGGLGGGYGGREVAGTPGEIIGTLGGALAGGVVAPTVARRVGQAVAEQGGVGTLGRRLLAEEIGGTRLPGEQPVTPARYQRILADFAQAEEINPLTGRATIDAAQLATPEHNAVRNLMQQTGKTSDDLLNEFAATRQVPDSLTTNVAMPPGTRISNLADEGVSETSLTPQEDLNQKWGSWSRKFREGWNRLEGERFDIRSQRSAAFEAERDRLMAEGVPQLEAIRQARGQFAGEMGRVDLPALDMTPEQEALILGRVSALRPYEQIRVQEALDKIRVASVEGTDTAAEEVRHIVRSDKKLLDSVMGDGFSQAVDDVSDRQLTMLQELGQDYPKKLPKPGAAEPDYNLVSYEAPAGTARAPQRTPNVFEHFLSLWKVPQQIKQAFDFSFHLRQAAMASVRNPKEAWASLKWDLRAWKSPQEAQLMDDALRNDSRMITVRTPDGFEQMTYGDAKTRVMRILRDLPGAEQTPEDIFSRDELIMSSVADKIPGVARSERGFITAGNKMRSDLAWKWMQPVLKREGSISQEQLLAIGEGVSRLTGKGFIPGGWFGNFLKATMWAPGYRASGVQALNKMLPPIRIAGRTVLGESDALVRRQMQENIGSWFIAGASLLGTLNLLSDKVTGLSIEMNPVNTDFGKIRIGNTSYNIWGTDQVLARALFRAAFGKGESRWGVEFDTDFGKEVLRYFQSGLDPVLSQGLQLLTGETYVGEKVRYDRQGILNQLREQLPLSIQDTIDVVLNDSPLQAAASLPPIALGIGATSYGGKEGLTGRLAAIPEFYNPAFGDKNLDANELNQVDDLNRRLDARKAELAREYGDRDIPQEQAIRVFGKQEGYSPRIIGAAIFYNKQSNRDKYRNPEWLNYIREHEGQLRREKPELFSRRPWLNAWLYEHTKGQ